MYIFIVCLRARALELYNTVNSQDTMGNLRIKTSLVGILFKRKLYHKKRMQHKKIKSRLKSSCRGRGTVRDLIWKFPRIRTKSSYRVTTKADKRLWWHVTSTIISRIRIVYYIYLSLDHKSCDEDSRVVLNLINNYRTSIENLYLILFPLFWEPLQRLRIMRLWWMVQLRSRANHENYFSPDFLPMLSSYFILFCENCEHFITCAYYDNLLNK